MLLAIDTGNTNTLFAIHDGEDWVMEWRIATDATRTADEYAVWFYQLLEMNSLKFEDISDCIIATVVPQSLFNMRNLARRHLGVEPMVVGEAGVKLGMTARIDNAKEVGADRLVTAIGALTRYKAPLLIVDSGTATTFDVINKDGDFVGGIIAPGINLSVKALHEAAAQLPRIAIKKPEKIIGTNTVGAMQSGIFWGYIGLIDGLIKRICSEGGQKYTIIGTGGIASLFEGASEEIQHYDNRLTIDGLLKIWQLNR
ncbi:MAG: type III pantothenate kinase [Robiginitomaculum sp.]